MNRKTIISRHNPILTAPAPDSPLSVGNGNFAFTADITGLQSLDSYTLCPLCTMSSWGWHTAPPLGGRTVTLADIKPTVYETRGREFRYPAMCAPGEEAAYKYLRHNPHRLNLAQIAFCIQSEPLTEAALTDICQELDLYTGFLSSTFKLNKQQVRVFTSAANSQDALSVRIEADEPLPRLGLTVRVSFPYGSHKKNASDWSRPEAHRTTITHEGDSGYLIHRMLDDSEYFVRFNLEKGLLKQTAAHTFELSAHGDKLEFTAHFAPKKEDIVKYWATRDIITDSREGFKEFWETGDFPDFSKNSHPQAAELERRAVLSMYLCRVHSAGAMPPQETGLACNSWYGKFHTEMHILHSGWLALWGRGKWLLPSIEWYLQILPAARENARQNGYAGARWPKMTEPAGRESPSFIAPLLIWQQPHIIYMLYMLYKQFDILRFWVLIEETADFMVSFAEPNPQTGYRDLPGPLIPAQEEHEPMDTLNPTFELAYWKFALNLACEMAAAFGKNAKNWGEAASQMQTPHPVNGQYPAHQNCPDTFTRYNRDHPSMLFACGFIPPNADIDKDAMRQTADAVLEKWDFSTLWGWDFAMLALCYAYLGDFDKAFNLLLTDTPKNTFVISGNNYQKGRDDLPLYLPGNGALLFALAYILKLSAPADNFADSR